MAQRKNKFLLKRSNVAGKIPTSGDLSLGEMALNTADVKLYASGTTANQILPIGWDRVATTGDTMSGDLFAPSFSATTFSGGTYYGDGSNLTGITSADTYLTGGTLTTGGTINLELNETAPDVLINLKETKRLVMTAEEGNTITAGRAYLGTSGSAFLSFGGVGTDDDQASFNFSVPSDYISGGTFYIKFTTQATVNDIQFEMNITSRDNGGDLSTPTDTAIQNSTTGSASSWDMVETSAYNPSGSTFSKDKNVAIRINRDASDAPDTFGGTAYIWGLVFEYTGIK
jgi:hypothetical protein